MNGYPDLTGWSGVTGGFIGGLILASFLWARGTLSMLGDLFGHGSSGYGLFILLMASVILGYAFARIVGKRVKSRRQAVAWPLLFAFAWWATNTFVFFPVVLGHGISLAYLPGHILYGLSLSLVLWWWLRQKRKEEELKDVGDDAKDEVTDAPNPE